MSTTGIRIVTNEGDRVVDGHDFGSWAATKMTLDDWLVRGNGHATDDEIWTVTHVESGRSIQNVADCRCLTELDAMRVAKLLSDRAPFKGTTTEHNSANGERYLVEAIVAEALSEGA